MASNATTAFFSLVAPGFREPRWTAPPAGTFPYVPAALLLQLLEFLWETYLDLRQRRRLQEPRFPPRLADAIAAVEQTQQKPAAPRNDGGSPLSLSLAESARRQFDTSRAYGLDTVAHSLVSRAVRAGVAAACLLLGVLPFAWTASGGVLERLGLDAERHEIARALVLVTLVAFKDAVLGVADSLYADFVVEARHGFQRQTLRGFAVDRLRLAALALPVMYAFVALSLLAARWAGERFFVYVAVLWAVLLLLVFALLPLAASLVERHAPLPEGELRRRIEALAARQRFAVPRIVVNDHSTRSGHSSASIAGLFRTKTVVLDDTLLRHVSDDQVLAVLCHEFGHAVLWHIPRGSLVQLLKDVAKLYAFGLCMARDAGMLASFGVATAARPPPLAAGFLVFSTAVWAPVERASAFAVTLMARAFEREADAYAVAMGHGAALQCALVRLFVENKKPLHPDRLFSAYHNRHPTLVERLDAIAQQQQQQQKQQQLDEKTEKLD